MSIMLHSSPTRIFLVILESFVNQPSFTVTSVMSLMLRGFNPSAKLNWIESIGNGETCIDDDDDDDDDDGDDDDDDSEGKR